MFFRQYHIIFILVILAIACNQRNDSSLDGDWEYIARYDVVIMTLNKDSSFKFYRSTCTGCYYTEGNWYKSGNIITLNSFPKYRSKEFLEKRESYAMPPPVCDTIRISFENILIKYKNDSLFPIENKYLRVPLIRHKKNNHTLLRDVYLMDLLVSRARDRCLA